MTEPKTVSNGRSIRVLNIFHRLMPSGAEVMWLQAASDFKSLGIEHVLLSIDDQIGPFGSRLEKEFEILHQQLPPGPWGAKALAKIAQRAKADLIHCHSESKGAAAAVAGQLAELPVVRTYHNIWETRNLRHAARRRIERRFSVPVAIGASVEAVESHWGPLKVISNWAKAGQPSRPELDSRRIRLLTVCNTNPIKRCDSMIEMVAKHPQLDLTHIGFDQESSFDRSKLENMGVADRIRSLGVQEDPVSQMGEYDAYVCTSEREGFSIAMTEALLCGTPLAFVDAPGVRDFLEYQPEAFIIDPGSDLPFAGLLDSIVRQRDQIDEKLPILREFFSAKRGAVEYAALYRELVVS